MKMDEQRVAKYKAEGFLQQKDKEHFAVRIVPVGAHMSTAHMRTVVNIAAEYGGGSINFTQRGAVEIPYIKAENIEAVKGKMVEAGLRHGGTGKRVRPIVCCKGTYCRFGQVDTQAWCAAMDRHFFGYPLPHKFKIALCGCSNNCTRIQLNDVGAMSMGRKGFRVFVGGRAGRELVAGQPLAAIVAPEALHETIGKILRFFEENGREKERLAQTIARLFAEDASFDLQKRIDACDSVPFLA